jgi:hypothetical protein
VRSTRFQKLRGKIKSQTSSSVLPWNTQYPDRVRVTRKREETVAESNLLFWLRRPGVRGVRSRERDPSAPSPGRPRLPRAGAQQPEPETRASPATGSALLAVPWASRLRSLETGADQLRPAGPRLPAPPGPPERGPRPRGAERAGAARRAGRGPGLPSRLPFSRGSALRDELPATPQSQRGDSGEWAPWPCPTSRSDPCPGETEQRQAQALGRCSASRSRRRRRGGVLFPSHRRSR